MPDIKRMKLHQKRIIAYLLACGDKKVLVGTADFRVFQERPHIRNHIPAADFELLGPESAGPLNVVDIDAVKFRKPAGRCVRDALFHRKGVTAGQKNHRNQSKNKWHYEYATGIISPESHFVIPQIHLRILSILLYYKIMLFYFIRMTEPSSPLRFRTFRIFQNE